MGRLDGKTALVTGGGRGIGRGIALAYAREGADVAIVARSRLEPEEVVAEIQALGRKGLVLTADLIPILNKEGRERVGGWCM